MERRVADLIAKRVGELLPPGYVPDYLLTAIFNYLYTQHPDGHIDEEIRMQGATLGFRLGYSMDVNNVSETLFKGHQLLLAAIRIQQQGGGLNFNDKNIEQGVHETIRECFPTAWDRILGPV